MRTKTGELLMRKKNEIAFKTEKEPVISQFDVHSSAIPTQQHLTRKQSKHISHVNEYQLVLSTNRTPPPPSSL